MRPQLKLVKSTRRSAFAARATEVRYRYPAAEEVWEVSCDECDAAGDEFGATDEEQGRRSIGRPPVQISRQAS